MWTCGSRARRPRRPPGSPDGTPITADLAPLARRSGRAVELDVRTNSLNLIRLALALLVLVAHGFYLSGAGTGPSLQGENLGGWAVFGFFTISGYLITASRFANPLGRYLVLRIARIYPAFLVCLVVTAGVFAPIAWAAEGRDWSAFLTTPTTPTAYVIENLGLRVNAYDVAGTPSAVPYPGAWNGSLWTLFFEFCCYLLVGLLICLPVVRRHRWIVAVGFALSVLAWATVDAWGPGAYPDLVLLARLLPAFLGGALVQVAIRWVPLRTPIALGAVVVAAVLVLTVAHWGAQVASPLIAYVLLWLSTVVPAPAVSRRHDISYGVYIYAFPLQQLLVYAGAHRLGLVAYDVLAALATAVVAVVSWRLVERPALHWARHRFRSPATMSTEGDRVVQERPDGAPPAARDDAGQQAHRVRP
ncbi:MAG: acyltransferase [Lapillicoccus sp.]